MAPILKVRGVKRVIAAQVTIDESTAIATAQTARPIRGSASGIPVLASLFFGISSRYSAPSVQRRLAIHPHGACRCLRYRQLSLVCMAQTY
jgi:hypothetical protein